MNDQELAQAKNASPSSTTSQSDVAPLPEQEPLFRALQEAKREIRGEILGIRTEFREEHSGWLPHPNTLAQYDKNFPGLAQKIVESALKEQDHRMQLENRQVAMAEKYTEAETSALTNETVMFGRGQKFAMCLIGISVAFSFYFFYMKIPTAGILGLVMAIITAFSSKVIPSRGTAEAPKPKADAVEIEKGEK